MHASLHELHGIPRADDTSWVDDVLDAVRTAGSPAGALVMTPLTPGPGYLLALWDAADAVAFRGPVRPSGVEVGAGRTYEVDSLRHRTSTSPARYLQLLAFDGPRTAEWGAAYLRAGDERIWPAVRDLPGIAAHLDGVATDGSRLSASLGESIEALENASAAIMSTDLLADEDPSQLTGPDSSGVFRLLHADLPVGASRGAER